MPLHRLCRRQSCGQTDLVKRTPNIREPILSSIWIAGCYFVVLAAGIVFAYRQRTQREPSSDRESTASGEHMTMGQRSELQTQQTRWGVRGVLGIVLVYLGAVVLLPWMFNLKDPALVRGLGYAALGVYVFPLVLGGIYLYAKKAHHP